MKTTKIEWTERTWNPVTGCSKISEGCVHCYAEIMARRLCAMGNEKYVNGFTPTLHADVLYEPMKWRTPSTIFVCSMGDLFHPSVPVDFIDKVMTVIRNTPQHTYQILTKRAEQMADYFSAHQVPSNAWIGVTVEVARTKSRIDCIRHIKAPIHFISCEPLLDDVGKLDLQGVDWIIIGGESGVSARPMKEEWVLNIKHQAEALHIPVFFKQWGTWGADGIRRNKKANGKLLQGKIVQQMPS